MKKVSIIVLIVIAFGCSKNANKSSSQESSDSWQIGKAVVSEGDVSITFTNNSDVSYALLDPMEKRVEVREGETWVKVSILYCDCGSPCPAPPDEKSIEPGAAFTFSWDKKVEECVGDEDAQETKKTMAASGQYRISYAYRVPGERQKQMLVAEFDL